MTKKIVVGNKIIGEGEPTFVVAEVGSNHDQNLSQAKELIEATAYSGADAVKFQVFSADSLYPAESELNAAVKRFELPTDWLPELAQYAEKCELVFFASPFFPDAVRLLTQAGVPAYKIASTETTNLPLLKLCASKGKPLLISTGLCDLADVSEAIDVVRAQGNDDILLYQCTARYPTEPCYVNLRVIDTLKAAFDVPVGLSDHTLGITVPVAAVARGASSIEKTITLNTGLPGPDHGYALDPTQFKEMVEAIRITEDALGSSQKTMLLEESEVDQRRECLRAIRDIEQGETITEDLIVIARPAYQGIRPRFLNAVIGRTALCLIEAGHPISWDKV